jgi:four helix bundle protein
MGNFQQLRVWQESKDLAVKIYKLTREKEFSKDFGFRDQVQRAAVSVSSNIAEGDESGSNKLCIRYLYIAKGSVAELQTQILIANEIGYVDMNKKTEIIAECDRISVMLRRLINARKG